MEVGTKELDNDVEMIDFGVMMPPMTPLHTNPLQYARSQGCLRLVSLVNKAYSYWRDQKPIPEEIRRKIEAVELTNDEYLVVFCNRETPEARAIELIDGRIHFREYTLPSHGAVSGNVSRQLVRQDPQDIFQCSSGVGRVLFAYFTDNEGIPLGNSNKQPDAMFFDCACKSTQRRSRTYLPTIPKWSDVIPSHLFRDCNLQRNSSKTFW